jgi:phenylacetate-CoA ligase
MLAIADEFVSQGLDARNCSLQVGIFGAEPWTEAMRAQIEEIMGLDAVDIYGISEVIGPGVANECIETKDGLVVWEDHFFPEIVDPQTGEVLPDGEFGELVLTSLSKEALPVIRYRTRDLTRLLPPTARSMRRMQKIVGRCDDMLIIRGVNVFPTQVEELILNTPTLAPHYCLEVTREKHLDMLIVHVEATTDEASARERAARELTRKIKSYIGLTARVSIDRPGSIERSLGKGEARGRQTHLVCALKERAGGMKCS